MASNARDPDAQRQQPSLLAYKPGDGYRRRLMNVAAYERHGPPDVVQVFRPIIDRRYPFDQIVEAHRYVDTGRKRGSVVVTLGE